METWAESVTQIEIYSGDVASDCKSWFCYKGDLNDPFQEQSRKMEGVAMVN